MIEWEKFDPMPTANEMDGLWAADFTLKQIPVKPRLPKMQGRIVGTVEYNKEKGVMDVTFFSDKKEENPPSSGG